MESLNKPGINCNEYKEKQHSKATASENGLTYELINVSKYKLSKWKIDDCIIKGEKSKCDYLFTVKEKNECYWIELKSEDFNHACLQIYSSINEIIETKEMNHYARIVLNKFTDKENGIKTLRYTNHKKLIGQIGGDHKIKYKNKLLTENI